MPSLFAKAHRAAELQKISDFGWNNVIKVAIIIHDPTWVNISR